jgi:hypothetical protein
MRFAALPPILVGVLTGGVYVVFRADTLTAGSGGTAAGVYYELTARRSLAARRTAKSRKKFDNYRIEYSGIVTGLGSNWLCGPRSERTCLRQDIKIVDFSDKRY